MRQSAGCLFILPTCLTISCSSFEISAAVVLSSVSFECKWPCTCRMLANKGTSAHTYGESHVILPSGGGSRLC